MDISLGRRSFGVTVLGLGVAALGFALTAWLVQQQRLDKTHIAHMRLTEEVRISTDALIKRINLYTEIATGLRDLFLVNPNLDRAEFERIAAIHNVIKNYPELRNVSFVRRVPAAASGTASGTPQSDGYIVEYVWPYKGNEGIRGLDISSQSSNFSALKAARETGLPVVSAPFQLAQEQEPHPAFVLRLPVYVPGNDIASPSPEFIGAVGVIVDADVMLSAIAATGALQNVSIQLNDIGSTSDNTVATTPAFLGAYSKEGGLPDNPGLSPQTRTLQVLNRQWHLSYQPSLSLLSTTERRIPWWIAGTGALLTLLLTAIFFLLARQRALALGKAERSYSALQSSEQQLLRILDHLPVGVLLIDRDQRIVFRNRRFEDISSYTAQNLVDMKTWWLRAYPEATKRRRAQQHWNLLAKQATKDDGIIAADEYEIACYDGDSRIMKIGGTLLSEGYLMVLEDVSQHKAAEKQINYLTFHDALTQLPNRHLLRDHLRRALHNSKQHQQWGAILLLDIDHFKSLNETRGHLLGDRLLCQIAERLREHTQDRRMLARHGDDEFVMILKGLSKQREEASLQAAAEAQRILDALQDPYLLDDIPYRTTASMGVVLFQGTSQNVDELLKRADLAMHQAKAAGRNTLRFYDPNIQMAVSTRAILDQDMRAGLGQNQFELLYQPQVKNDRIVGAEALLRWNHPQNGLISPAVFIPLAESTGSIVPIGNWVLQTACKQLTAWANLPELAHLHMSVNVSPRQFHQSDFVAQVLDILTDTGARPERLKIELTEGVLLQDVEDTITKMTELQGHGVRFSLDDFGTGYSSLAYLKRLPLDELKIDQSFVRDVLNNRHDAAIARTIVVLGTSLGLGVVAEGVETKAQRDFLASNQCHAWQGYLLSKPIPIQPFEVLVRQHQAQR